MKFNIIELHLLLMGMYLVMQFTYGSSLAFNYKLLIAIYVYVFLLMVSFFRDDTVLPE